jgi:MarR family transcriptional regulator, transcriptional regulator for hemolysin
VRVVNQSFERELAEAGGSLPVWQVLLLIRTRQCNTQSDMAEELGITGATLTHHLNALEDRGLVRRWRETSNRRAQRVELTDAGLELFHRLREVALRHDQRLRSVLGQEETELLADLLDRLRAGVSPAAPPHPPPAATG